MDATASHHANGELYYEHRGEARGLRARQYVYGIGSYHYNWHTALELLVVVTSALGETDHIIAHRHGRRLPRRQGLQHGIPTYLRTHAVDLPTAAHRGHARG